MTDDKRKQPFEDNDMNSNNEQEKGGEATVTEEDMEDFEDDTDLNETNPSTTDLDDDR